jgi:hypothetical protein
MGSNPIIGMPENIDLARQNSRIGILSIADSRARKRIKTPSIRQVFVKWRTEQTFIVLDINVAARLVLRV